MFQPLRMTTVGPKYFHQLPQETQEFLTRMGFEPTSENDDTGYGMADCMCVFVLPADDFDFNWYQCSQHCAQPSQQQEPQE